MSPLLSAQTPPSEGQPLAVLMTEVHELRLAIERSTLLGARTQIAILRIQQQEQRVARASQTRESVRQEVVREQAGRAQMAMILKDLESKLSQASNPDALRQIETEIQGVKQQVADGSSEAQVRTREAEAFGQLQTEQSRLTQLQAEMSQLEAALDTAIQQVTPRR